MISSTPITPDQAHTAISQIQYGTLAQILSAEGEDVSGKSRADLVAMAWNHYEASMGNLDIGSVDAAASLANFEAGRASWTYYSDRVFV